MDKNDLKSKSKVDQVLKYAKEKLTDFRVDERRKVIIYQASVVCLLGHHIMCCQLLGIRPFSSYPTKDTATLARDIIKSIKGPTDMDTQEEYIRNLTILVRAINIQDQSHIGL